MAVVLAAAGAFVFSQLRSDLDDRVNSELESRATAAAELVTAGRVASSPTSDLSGFAVAEESLVQILDRAGSVVESRGGPSAPVLSPAALARVPAGPVWEERRVPGIDGTTRLRAQVVEGPSGSRIVVVGQSLEDRDDALASVIRSFALGGPLAILLASAIGYLLATAGFRPVEAMRRQARAIALGDERGRLPLPAAADEIRSLGETLNEMLDRLRSSLESERRFVADASHELRTPIAVVKTELEGALRTGDFGPDVRESLVAAVEECDSLAQLAEDLLVLARAGAGTLPVRREPVAVRALLESARDRFADRATLHGRTIDVEADPGLRASADPLRLRQALGNLVDNALRHGRGRILLGARAADGGVELVVSDEGDGFGEDIAGRAFERFSRSGAARGGAGAGLGLAIVRAIAEAHGGTAAVLPGADGAVRLWLPDPGGGPAPRGPAPRP